MKSEIYEAASLAFNMESDIYEVGSLAFNMEAEIIFLKNSGKYSCPETHF